MQIVTREQIDSLVRSACFAADTAAMESFKTTSSSAEHTQIIVERTVEFLLGNGLVEIVEGGRDRWLKIDPPYDKIEPKEESN